jgi:2-methylfumaryl-CoA hydratase
MMTMSNRSKINVGNYFEDFQRYQTFTHGIPRTVTEGEVSLYIALTGSRQILYSAAPVAHAMGLKERPLEDLLAFHIAFGKTVADISLNAVANLGYADVRFLRPVYPGDTLHTETTVVGLKENSNHTSGTVYVRSTTYNQSGAPVLTWLRWVMVPKKDPAHPAPSPMVPALPPCVAPEQLPVPEGLSARGFECTLTGSPHLWEDYTVGERIDHLDGMTLDESDHTLATKLYQNNARLHFDAQLMGPTRFGRRLVYGGHVISICRALSYNGLANALCIAAINGGTHCNPTFAGDTLYAYTEVLERWPLPQRTDLGALRLRTLGVKNLASQAVETAQVEGEGERRYHDHVVLDLDYTVLMPRRGAAAADEG